MKHFINTAYHGIGCLLLCIGLIICLGMAGNSDLGMPLSMVMRYSVCGLLIMVFGLFLTRWKV